MLSAKIKLMSIIFITLATTGLKVPECTAVQIGRAGSSKDDLGRGVQGVVRKISQTEVVKIMDIDPTNNSLAEAEREISILLALRHYPRASQLYSACVERKNGNTRFYLFMEACELELFDYIDKSVNTHKDLYRVFLELVTIFKDINSMGVFHIDNQARNAMICHRRLKLIDFGKGFINTAATNTYQKGIEIMNLENLFRNIQDRIGFQENSLRELFMKMRSQGMLARRKQPMTISLDEIQAVIMELARKATDEKLPKANANKGGEFIVANPHNKGFPFLSMLKKPLANLQNLFKGKDQIAFNDAQNLKNAEQKNQAIAKLNGEAEIFTEAIKLEKEDLNSPAQWELLMADIFGSEDKSEKEPMIQNSFKKDEKAQNLVL